MKLVNVALALTVIAANASADSRLLIVHKAGAQSRGLSLTCLPQPKLCKVSRFEGLSTTASKNLATAEGDKILEAFGKDLPRLKDPKAASIEGPSVHFDYAYGKTTQKSDIGAKATDALATLMKWESLLEKALQ